MGYFTDWKNLIDPLNTRKLLPSGKSGSGGGGFVYEPYSGHRPPLPEFTRETENLYKDTIFPRSQGVGVGYDPQRRQLLTDLVKSEIGQQEEDQLRSAQGAISRSGLSGNPRAYEALAGRVKRDSGRQLADSLAKISIEDLTYAADERDRNTDRLGNFNLFNFGQENNRAGFDLDVYNAEQGNRMGAAQFNQGVQERATDRRNELFSDLGGLAVSIGGLAMGNPAPAISYGVGKIGQSGTGISPTTQNGLNYYGQPGARSNRSYLSLMR